MPLTREQQIELMRTARERHNALMEARLAKLRGFILAAHARAREAAESRGYQLDPRIAAARGIKTGG